MFKSLVDFFSSIQGSEEVDDEEEISPAAFKQKVDDPKFRCYLLPGEKRDMKGTHQLSLTDANQDLWW